VIAVSASPPTDCPSEDRLLAFAGGASAAANRAAIIDHLDGCAECRAVVVAVSADEPGATTAPLRIGRYLVERPIGAGAMGLVFRARDAELDRAVALKLLRRSLDSDDDERLEQRLLGEARALAKLAHPNVVAVFEVARHDGELYLVMELIEGPTLSAWLLAAARTTDEVLAMFAQAGRGLAAAHAAGIVHRDVKLDNVLVGADGRARITDFGLATGALAGPLPAVHGDDIALTMTGALAGTPAYMAPEVLRGGDATPQSDQFGFAVALWCGLCGARPFHGDSVDALLRAIEIDDPRLPPGRRIDARVRAVVARGLATDPAARWPSVAAMLDALERARPGRRTRTIAIAGAVAVIAAGAAAAAVTRDHRGPTCATDGAVWTPAAAAKVQAALRAAAPELAATATTAVADAVARWQARWDHERLATCRQGGEVEAARGGCLDLQRRQVESTVALLGEATGAVAEDAIVTADRLPDPRACVRAAGTPVTDRSAAARALAARLADARALHHVGRFADAATACAAIVAAATAGGHAGVRLDALLLLAESQSDDGERKAALTTFDQATTLAIARGDDHALAEALVHLVSVHANGGELAAHELALGLATAALARAGGDPELDALLAQGRCRAGWRRPAELERGVRDCEEAARRWRARRGGDSYEATGVVNQLGLLAYTGGHYEEALAQFQRYEQLNLRWHSPTHHNTDTARVNAADTLVKLGRAAEAEPIVRDVLTHRAWGSAYDVLGQVLRQRHDVAAAIDAFRHQATAGATLGYGGDHCLGLVAVAELELERRDRVAAAAALAEATPVCTQHAITDAAPRLAALRTALAISGTDR